MTTRPRFRRCHAPCAGHPNRGPMASTAEAWAAGTPHFGVEHEHQGPRPYHVNDGMLRLPVWSRSA
jgi:hypothetical protein